MSDIKDFEIENGVLKKYIGNGGDVVIPEGVTSIGEDAFSQCKAVESVTISDRVNSIENSAFDGCKNLIRVTIPDSVTSIGRYAFWNSGLTDISIPAGVKTVGANAFEYTPLQKIRICGNPEIGENAFHPRSDDMNGSRRLTNGIIIPEIEAPDGVEVLPYVLIFETLRTDFFHALLKQQFTVRETDTKYYIKRMMSRMKTLGAKIFPDLTVQELRLIERYGFITVKNSDTLLDFFKDNAECRAELLDYINKNISTEQREDFEQKKFDKDVEKSIKRNKILDDALNLFYQKSPEEIKKEWVTSDSPDGLCINKYKGNDTVIVIPSVIGGKQVAVLAENAMRAGTTSMDGRKNSYNKKMYKNKAVIISDGIVEIGENAFNGCAYMTDVCIPSSVARIASDAFHACHKLTVHAPSGSYAEKYAIENNIPFVAE